jgi:predicted transcriptional regulator
VSHVIIYATKPVGHVVGYFSVDGVTTGSPTKLWNAFGRVGGVSRSKFRDYFRAARTGSAIRVGKTHRLAEPLSLTDIGEERPPQNFVYVGRDRFEGALTDSEQQAR